MRLLIITLFLCSGMLCTAQRPWALRSPMLAGPKPTVVNAASSVFVFDTAAMRTFDYGTTWDPVTGYAGKMCGITDFTAGLTLLTSYTEVDRTVHMYYSIGGAAWTSFIEFADAARPIGITASSTEWFLAFENSNQIYVYGDQLNKVSLPPSTNVVGIKYWEGQLLVLDSEKGLYISSDKGSTWQFAAITGGVALHASAMGVFLATNSGVVSVDIPSRKVTQVGTWPAGATAPRIADVDNHISALYAYSDDGAFQLYRLLGQNWEPTGYPLPGTKANRSASVLTIDAGYAVLAHALIEGHKDSAGVYVYDLNDFTNVDNQELPSAVAPRIVGDVIHLVPETDVSQPIQVWSLRGELVCEIPVHSNSVDVSALTKGTFIIRVQRRASNQPWNIVVSR